MPISRRAFAGKLAAALSALGVSRADLFAAGSQSDLGIAHNADIIRQEGLIRASPARVYAALTDARRFDAVVKLSAATKSMALKPDPSVLAKEPGGAISLFGGYVTGRQVELVQDQRIVQVWRAASWKAGEYSLVKFELAAQGSNTKLALVHTGFPAGEAQHLAEGWKGNYFEPLAAYLR